MTMDDVVSKPQGADGTSHGDPLGLNWGEQIFEAAPVGLLVVDANGLIVQANAALCAIFGYDRYTLPGKGMEFLLPERYRKDHSAALAAGQRIPEKRAIGAGSDLHGLRSDGTEFPVEIGLDPIVLGSRAMTLASVLDISERNRMLQQFEQIVDAAPQGILIIDQAATITLVNSSLCEIFGHAAEDLIGSPLECLLPERYREGHVGIRNGFLAEPHKRAMGLGQDLTALHRDGTEFPVEIGLSPIVSESGMSILASVTDITGRKNAEHKLQQANRELEEFTSVASHDLRSPLRGIANLLEWIEEDLGDGAPQTVRGHIDKAAIRVRRMERLIDDLLDYARAGQQSDEVEVIDVDMLTNEILGLVAPESGFTFEKDIRVAPFHGSRVPLETCIRNLVSNAIKHHDRDTGHIVISAVEEAGYCVTRVTDDGPGIPPEVRDRVFRLFQTLNASKDGGTGLGLAISKRLVEGHGGSICIESSETGRGTTFRFQWPMFHRRDLGDGEKA
ncbi:MAG: PAS domain-containing sensor histidine kinase [Proteobacteria bacterium]|nr:PAS domain-containing sensor histidine kinase [Pseudomonadota bacterium]